VNAVGDFPIGFGRYQLIERLAIGGMAELYVATAPGEHGFQKKVVIKRLLPHLVEDATYNAMFIDEAKLTARLVHPKIAQTFELGKVDGNLFIAMEHVDGIDVLALLREYAAKRRRVEPQLAAWIAHEVLDALDYAHHISGEDGRALGIVHRDISPSNVLLSVRGDIKLVDFGIARAVDPDRAHKSKSGTLKGKYGYMSPEQVIEQNLDERSDLFSVGVVLAELLTGRRLFAAANELDVLLMVRDAKLARFDKYGADLEPGLTEIVRRALRKAADERWQSAAVFRDALAEWLFEHRHRVTTKQVADVVQELRGAVIERRTRTLNRISQPPENIEISQPVLEPSDDGPGLVLTLDDGPSMPQISVQYADSATSPGGSAGGRRPVSVGDLSARAETIQARPVTGPTPKGPYDAREPVRERPSTTNPPRRASPNTVPLRGPTATVPPLRVRDDKPSRMPDRRAGARDGVPEAPIADTISAAIENITLPAEELTTREMPVVQPPPGLGSEDSAMRAFEDLTDDPPPVRTSSVRPPTAEEALRKKPPTPPALADIPEPPDDSGEFHMTSPLRVLFRLMTARATGLLVVAVGGIKKEIYVRDGQPEYVSSNVASELFGNYLVTKGVLSDGELAMALAMMPHYGGKLGDTLVGLGLLKPLEVFRHLTRQVRTKIIDVCTWNKGTFGWYAGRENPREAFPLDFNAFEILGAGALALSDDHIETWIAKHGGLRLRASRTRRVGPERFEVKGLVELCEMLDGKRSVGDLVELQPDRTERLRMGRMLCLLESCDLARPS
jgi:eukaryotic-like serine/threonine-protein kinase